MTKREIKFRGKKHNSEWVYGDYFNNHDIGANNDFIINHNDMSGTGQEFYIDIEFLCQYTGLKDKNLNKIYEGDIVRWDDMSNGKYWRIAVVKIDPDIQFDCSEIKITPNAKSNYCFNFGEFIYKDTHKHLEIIGNIYDNPELLK